MVVRRRERSIAIADHRPSSRRFDSTDELKSRRTGSVAYTDRVKGLRFVIGFLVVATVISVAAMLLLYVVVAQEPRVPSQRHAGAQPVGRPAGSASRARCSAAATSSPCAATSS